MNKSRENNTSSSLLQKMWIYHYIRHNQNSWQDMLKKNKILRQLLGKTHQSESKKICSFEYN